MIHQIKTTISLKLNSQLYKITSYIGHKKKEVIQVTLIETLTVQTDNTIYEILIKLVKFAV